MSKNIPRLISKQIAQFIPIKTLQNLDTPPFQPFYHVVSDEKLPHILNYNYRNISQFTEEIDFYLKHFKPVSLEELIVNPRSTEKMFHISFDDGLKECAEIIAPILLRKGIPATFFVNPGFVDNQSLFHKYKASLILRKLNQSAHPEAERVLVENNLQGKNILKATILQVEVLNKVAEMLEIDFIEFLKQQQPYLTTQQILQLKNQGFSIGAHSFNHPEFWKISVEEQLDEIENSMNWLVGKVNPEIRAFSFPFTDSGVSLKVLKKLKILGICDVTFGTAGIKYDELENHFQRYPVETSGDFMMNLKAELVYFVLRKQIGKATVKH